ncbi:MAG: isoprenylcysteine carboxylmethyltransferase family protein [SAR324 cluster bacterium]|nr:isoprenylcysteine carboxylmethyltransferase family protein [SAR324 cluster bacterium]MCZ6843861.1 isoprenylcysteine carboxylmethyltransferase family protein [SAR324 cluster bacterium]
MSDNGKDAPGVIAPPPLILLGFLLVGFLIDYFWPLNLLPDNVQFPAGGALIAAGVMGIVLAVREMLRAGTNIPTHRPSTAIVHSGPYKYSRNPIYLSAAIAYVGIAIMADNVWLLLMLKPLLVTLSFGVIDREEKYLEGKFGEDYRNYKAAVRRWI